jgi:hypothetical protein
MVRFLADASLHEGIVSGCIRREPAIDFLSANDAGLEECRILTFWLWRRNRLAWL